MANPLIGVAVGKFNPPHLGHAHLVRTAAGQVDHLYVIVGDRPDQTIPASDRAAWLADAAPDNVTVIVTPDDLPEANEPWAQRALEVLPQPPSVAFTSEEWGPGWANAMEARHVAIDIDRTEHSISATAIRADLTSHFDWLVPAARAALAKRVVVAGAESTGKTTLAEVLARHYGTVWVPEYGRLYWESRRHLPDQRWTAAEFQHIAETHHRIGDTVARQATNGLVVLDTDALVTNAWRSRYLGNGDARLVEQATAPRPDLYLLCAPDFAWVQDGSRESEDHRQTMHHQTLAMIEQIGTEHHLLTGDLEQRFNEAVAAIDSLIQFPRLV